MLRKIKNLVYYYKNQQQREIDFLIKIANKTILIQVCESLQQIQTRTRKIKALKEAMSELNLTNGIIVTRHEE